MAQPETESDKRADDNSAELVGSLSQFVTRILDQLSLSSWLPAIMIVCNLALVLQMHNQRNVNLGQAVIALTRKPLGILVVLIFSIIVMSMITQAFTFQAIRFLEGYWRATPILNLVSKRLTRRHVSRLERLNKLYESYEIKAFTVAKEKMIDEHVPRKLIDVIDKQYRDKPLGHASAELIAKATEVGWRRYAPAELLQRMDAIEKTIEEYPSPHRILPTRLGNTLRATEDQLNRDPGEPLEEFVLRRYSSIGPELNAQHRRFRSQLDIYCTLTLAFSGLAIASAAILADIALAAALYSGYVILSFVSYQAAIASARSYVRILNVISASPGDASKH